MGEKFCWDDVGESCPEKNMLNKDNLKSETRLINVQGNSNRGRNLPQHGSWLWRKVPPKPFWWGKVSPDMSTCRLGSSAAHEGGSWGHELKKSSQVQGAVLPCLGSVGFGERGLKRARRACKLIWGCHRGGGREKIEGPLSPHVLKVGEPRRPVDFVLLETLFLNFLY